jgi:hypothetical protein
MSAIHVGEFKDDWINASLAPVRMSAIRAPPSDWVAPLLDEAVARREKVEIFVSEACFIC